MCDIGNIFDKIGGGIQRMFTLPGALTNPPKQDEALIAQNQQLMQGQQDLARQSLDFAKGQATDAKAASDKALADQTKATTDAAAKSVPAVDLPSAQINADARLRKLLSAGAFGVKMGGRVTGAPPLGFRTATGQ